MDETLFKNTYNQETFGKFLREFLPDTLRYQVEAIKFGNNANGKIETIVKLGECQLAGDSLQIFEVTHKSENDPRITLSQEIFRFLKSLNIYDALVVFKSENSKNWRLSLIHSTPTLAGKLEVSDFHRYSFYLGPDAKIHTPAEQLIKKGRVLNLQNLIDRFSLEVVNKDFYTQIAQSFYDLVGAKILKGKEIQKIEGQLILPIPNTANGDNRQLYQEFAVRLISRLVFCWFLKQKRSPKGTPLITDDIISTQAVATHSNYYHFVLEPLFYELLNTPTNLRQKGNGLASPYNEDIPYLNGGLFEPKKGKDSDYYSEHNSDFSLKIPDNWFNDFFTTLESFNFTIDESSTIDVDLSIDPEMLGRIFENLLSEINPETQESARKSTGSFYTPREIVDYMTTQSLTFYLIDKTGIVDKQIKDLLDYAIPYENSLTEPQINALIKAIDELKIIDPACGSGAFPMGVLQKLLLVLSKIDPKSEHWFSTKFLKDPLLQSVYTKKYKDENFEYIHKLGLIRDSIFGVDIQPIAVEISKLRFFLSLIVDDSVTDDGDHNRGIEPLPNLDFKFVCANSLINLPKEVENNSLLSLSKDETKYFTDLASFMTSYFSESNPLAKINIRNQIIEIVKSKIKEKEATLNSLATSHSNDKAISDLSYQINLWTSYKNIFNGQKVGFFDYRYFFPQVKDGFELVIANPPYVGEKGHKDIFRETKKGSLGNFYQGKMDLFYFFFHLALNLGNNHSQVAFITTNYYPTALGARKLREDFKNRSTIEKLINFNELKIFKSALGQHNMITILSKGQNEDAIAETCITKRTGDATPEILNKIVNWQDKNTEYFKVTQKDIYDGENYDIRIPGTAIKKNDPILTILSKIKNQGELLGLLFNINTGIQTGADKVSQKHIDKYAIKANAGDGIFVLSNEEVERLHLTGKEKEILKPWFKNSDIYGEGTITITNEHLLYIDREIKTVGDGIKEHLKKYRGILDERREVKNGVINWWQLQWPREQSIFESPKIVAPQRSSRNTFGYNEIPWYASADVYFITEKNKSLDLKYVLALLNSKLYYLWLYYRGKRKGETLELYQQPLSEIPIRKISTNDQKPFIEIVDKILAITKDGDYLQNETKQKKVKEYEQKIDQLIYKLYDLTPEEIKIIENSIKQ